jgi:hypothetical protein
MTKGTSVCGWSRHAPEHISGLTGQRANPPQAQRDHRGPAGPVCHLGVASRNSKASAARNDPEASPL